VKEINDQGVVVSSSGSETSIPTRTVLWAAGVKASPLGGLLQQRADAELDRGGRVLVRSDCSLPNHPEILVIGDLAAHRDLNGNPLPGLAPVAMQQGAYVGRMIGKHLRGETVQPFQYVDKGTLATIGRNRAVASFRKLRFGGFVAWIVWLFVHLLYLVGFQNRVLVVIQWAFHYFTYNRKARLIVATGPTSSASNHSYDCCAPIIWSREGEVNRACDTTRH
jgi:NADH dehydrogenase